MILYPLAFIAGVLTIVSPCVLPVVPMILGTTLAGRSVQAIAILVGFGLAFVLATVALASTLAAAGATTSGIRLVAVVILGLAGATVALPALGARVERLVSATGPVGTRVVGSVPPAGVTRGLVIGSMIGLLWAPCVGPLMASVIASALVIGPTAEGTAVAVAYVAGTAAALGVVAFGGRRLVRAIRPVWSDRLRRAAGAVMVATAVLVLAGVDQTLGAALPSLVDPAATEAVVAGMNPSVTDAEETPVNASTSTLPDLGAAPELTGITDWINSEPLSLASLRGKVVLVHFWTFGCINCQHVQPYVKAWADRYAADGLVVVGVHTPELSFERDIANVRQAVIDDGVDFPVAFDPAYATWNAYGNHYWPAFYFVDRDGRIRHTHFGEGDYDGSEAVIRALLATPASGVS